MLEERNRWSLEFWIGLSILWNPKSKKYKGSWYYSSINPCEATKIWVPISAPQNPKKIAVTIAKDNLSRQRHPIPIKIMQAVHELLIKDDQYQLPSSHDVLEVLQRI